MRKNKEVHKTSIVRFGKQKAEYLSLKEKRRRDTVQLASLIYDIYKDSFNGVKVPNINKVLKDGNENV